MLVATPADGYRLTAGLEFEYRVSGATPVDFRSLIHDLGLTHGGLDAGDLRAFRLSSGAILTADGPEAEIALPPIQCAPQFTSRAVAQSSTERAWFRSLLPNHMRLDGYSTHLSIGTPTHFNERISLEYVRAFAPALMVLMDGPFSPGLLVRARPNRVELGGEYVDGVRLRAALAFALGSVLVCAAALQKKGELPPKLRLRL
ncbi:MAG: hypothetical protein ACRD1T_11880, partial [Acidimicrobiia bacterium]